MVFLLFNADHTEYLSRSVKGKRQTPLIVFAIMAAALYFLDRPILAISAVVIGIGIYLYYPIALRRNRVAFLKDHIRVCCQHILEGPTTITLESDGIHEQNQFHSALHSYSSFTEVTHHEGNTYAYLNNGTAMVLPHDRILPEHLQALECAIAERKRS